MTTIQNFQVNFIIKCVEKKKKDFIETLKESLHMNISNEEVYFPQELWEDENVKFSLNGLRYLLS